MSEHPNITAAREKLKKRYSESSLRNETASKCCVGVSLRSEEKKFLTEKSDGKPALLARRIIQEWIKLNKRV